MKSRLYGFEDSAAGPESPPHAWRRAITPFANYEAPATLGRSRIGAGAFGLRGGRGFRIAPARTATHRGERPETVKKVLAFARIMFELCVVRLRWSTLGFAW